MNSLHQQHQVITSRAQHRVQRQSVCIQHCGHGHRCLLAVAVLAWSADYSLLMLDELLPTMQVWISASWQGCPEIKGGGNFCSKQSGACHYQESSSIR